MIPLTEAELLRMRKVQAAEDYEQFCARADTDWPRVMEWALEARRVLKEAVDFPGRPERWYDEARRLLGDH